MRILWSTRKPTQRTKNAGACSGEEDLYFD